MRQRTSVTDEKRLAASVACKNYRARNRMSQLKMAEDMGCAITYISRVETQSPYPVPSWLYDKILRYCSHPDDDIM